METIARRFAELRTEVPPNVRIVAVTKTQPIEAVLEAIEAGVADIGENYVQEARRKFRQPDGPRHPGVPAGVTKHFIGHIQTNKAKAIAAVFDVVQSVDRFEAGVALAKAAEALDKRLPVLLQVNVSPTERFGCPPGEAETLAEALRGLPSLQLDGVMAIGPMTGDRDEVARAFRLAADVFARVGGETLSIGMSGDWREAVSAGSTMIRVGTTIFGPRPSASVSKNAVM